MLISLIVCGVKSASDDCSSSDDNGRSPWNSLEEEISFLVNYWTQGSVDECGQFAEGRSTVGDSPVSPGGDSRVRDWRAAIDGQVLEPFTDEGNQHFFPHFLHNILQQPQSFF